MNNRKRNIQGFTISLFIFALFIGMFTFIKNFSVSYAIDTGINKSGFLHQRLKLIIQLHQLQIT